MNELLYYEVMKNKESKTTIIEGYRQIRDDLLRCLETLKYHLKIDDSVYFHSLGIIDKYLESKREIDGEDLTLVAISSFIIANKFENQNSDYLEDSMLKYFKKNYKRYDAEKVYEMEIQILLTIKFEIVFPTAYSFYSFDVKRRILDKEEEVLLKLSMLNFHIIRNFKPSTIAKAVKKLIEFREEGNELFSLYRQSYDLDVNRCLDHLKQTLEYEVKLYKESLKPKDVFINKTVLQS